MNDLSEEMKARLEKWRENRDKPIKPIKKTDRVYRPIKGSGDEEDELKEMERRWKTQ